MRALAITIITGFRGFRPSWLGKLSTLIQVLAVVLILVASISGSSFFLPTVYTTVTALAVFSGVHYVFQVSWLMREAERGQRARELSS